MGYLNQRFIEDQQGGVGPFCGKFSFVDFNSLLLGDNPNTLPFPLFSKPVFVTIPSQKKFRQLCVICLNLGFTNLQILGFNSLYIYRN